MDLKDLKRISKRSVRNAGPRYTPMQDPTAPNLEISSLKAAFEGLICGKPFQDRLIELSKSLEETWHDAHRAVNKTYPRQVFKPRQLLNLIEKLACSAPGKGRTIITKAKASAHGIDVKLTKLMDILYEEEKRRRDEIRDAEKAGKQMVAPEMDDKVRNVREKRSRLTQYESALQDIIQFLDSSACDLQYNNVALLLGTWGTGKTHYLCDLATNRIQANSPVLIVLAKDFEPEDNVGCSLAKYTGLSHDFENLIKQLNKLGQAKRERALLIVDGVNESNQQTWKKDLHSIIRLLKQYNYVGFIISCRKPFDSLIFDDSLRRNFVELIHEGFIDIEFDAQTEFFRYYDIPLPEVPLLAEEFSRPLALKIMCEAFTILPKKAQRKGFAGIASGQRGMTFILEKFINRRAEEIEKDMGLPKKFCWTLIKGDDSINDPLKAGIAPHMAERLVNYVSKEDCVKIFTERSEITTLDEAKKLYRQFISEGILVEDIIWRPDDKGGSFTAIRLPYERFSDHIISRHLLARYLNTINENTIRRSFYSNRPLGKIFSFTNPQVPRYRNEGWGEATIVEFPERVKKILPKEKRELFFYLPKSKQNLSAYFSPFVSGLFWRNGDSISQQTDRIVARFFWGGNEYSRAKIIEAMLAVATKYKHPYNGARLYLNLEQVLMRERDLHWSEFLRRRSGDSTVERLIRWFESHLPTTLNEENALNQIISLSIMLTTTDRVLRDRVTRVLVLLGEQFPDALFKHTLKSLRFNDLYVPERMLAACYGVAMSLWADRNAHRFHEVFPDFAKALFKEVFMPGGKCLTHHALIREYALGVNNLAEKCRPRCIPTKYKKYLKPPFQGVPDPFPSDSQVNDKEYPDADYAIRMDFGNYTIGRLVRDRDNYHMNHPEYKRVRQKIEWRIVDLGYRKKAFEHIDRWISEDNHWRERVELGKINRYGKKYSWIAYFEMFGLLQSRDLLPDLWQNERISDCDVDPSFPISPPEWIPKLKRLFPKRNQGDVQCIKEGPIPEYDHLLEPNEINSIQGSWILLDGYIREEEHKTKREIFSFLRGSIIKDVDIPVLEDRLQNSVRPELPNPGEDFYTFAGEVPWSKQFAAGLRTKTGKLSKTSEEAFPISFSTDKRKHVKKAWKKVYEILETIPNLQNLVASRHETDTEETTEQSRLDKLEEAINKANAQVPEPDRLTVQDLIWQVPSIEEVKNGFRHVRVWERTPGIPVETTCWRYNWGGNHSKINDLSGFLFPSPRICEQLELVGSYRSIELVDRNGHQATIYRTSNSQGKKNEFLYLRQDLLNEYLHSTNKKLIWIVWGQRQFHYEIVERKMREKEISAAYQANKHIHKRLIKYMC